MKIHRRDFITLTSLAALQLGAAPLKTSARPRLSVIFDDGTGIVDARALYGGDARFLREGARVRVDSASGLNLTALYKVEIDGKVETVPFVAASASSIPTQFVMPVDSDDSLAFELEQSHLLQFTINPRDNAFALRKGTYLVSLDEKTLKISFDYEVQETTA